MISRPRLVLLGSALLAAVVVAVAFAHAPLLRQGSGGQASPRCYKGNLHTHTVNSDEGYLRAKALESNGQVAWIQPVPVGASGPR